MNTFMVLLGGAIAALIAGFLSYKVKISEFRQAWIDALRQDIADYIGATHRWARYYDAFDLETSDERRAVIARTKLSPAANKARVILDRIKMRINPRTNPQKEADDEFLRCLGNLLNPDKLPPKKPDSSTTLEMRWSCAAEEAVEQAREILKREWEVTKNVWPTWLRRLFCGSETPVR